ncbi:Heat shock transcription factor [Trema orientale]|uniref:Heat shock transcription factor n=1 Tax=Trema orientale TaxID=63057 RepID=A0A2P5F8U6_TREOI|nr:Heat shock transcription factor [Trema orientale]
MAMMLDNSCEGILLSLDSHKSVPAPFLTKTYQLVDDPATDHIVSWGEDDITFVVWRPPEFARDLLPNYFKHNNFSSFVRQLNTYGFRKIVPDRWEFANDFFKKGEKHLLCEIHRRKTAQPQVTALNHLNHHHMSHQYPHHSSSLGPAGFFPAISANRVSLSPPSDSDDQPNWWDSPPRGGGAVTAAAAAGSSAVLAGGNNYNASSAVTALSEDNERLRRSNSMLMSELAHMRKLYNDIIYFVQNHVKPVAPSNSYNPSSLLVCNAPVVLPSSLTSSGSTNNGSSVQKAPVNNSLGYYYNNNSNNPKQNPHHHHHHQAQQPINSLSPSNTTTSKSSVTILEEPTSNINGGCKTKLFGVPLQSKKRLHPEYGLNNINIATKMDTNKARLVLEKDDLGLNLMPPSTC